MFSLGISLGLYGNELKLLSFEIKRVFKVQAKPAQADTRRRKYNVKFKMAESTNENSLDTENDKEDLFKGYERDYDRIERLFKDLDRNNDGKIDANELASGLKRLRVRHSKGQLKVGFIIYLSSFKKC